MEFSVTNPSTSDNGREGGMSLITVKLYIILYMLQSVNDVITGIIFYGVRLYMQDIDYRSRTSKSTAVVLANTRNAKDYHTVQDMLKTTEGAWGNHFTLLHVSMPKLKDTPISDPLRFVRKAHTSIKKKRNSFATLLNQKLLLMKNKFKGPEVSYNLW